MEVGQKSFPSLCGAMPGIPTKHRQTKVKTKEGTDFLGYL